MKKLIDDLPKMKMLQENGSANNSMLSTSDESILSNQDKVLSEYDKVKQEMINFQKQIST
jgi:hypothetical protein